MVTRTKTRFAGYDCIKLENEALVLWVTHSVGPRIIGLALRGGENLFAVLPDDTVACPGIGSFSFRGGHRLWVAPENPRRTYLPDDKPVVVTEIDDGVCATQPVESQTGIQKSLAITLPGSDPRVAVDHTLYNRGHSPVDLAPWAITQLKPGGVAVLPQPTSPADEYGVLPNRQFALWPYTPMNSPHITWGDRYVFVEATLRDGALKIGYPNPAGWLGYAVDGTFFVKHAAYQSSADYFDRASSSECYCKDQFIELETLGPRTTLFPGGSVTHREVWAIYADVSLRPDEAMAQTLVGMLALETG
ncbi:MAG TPA: hypothetical protein ENN99_05550 [Chloroflexi bacterium]|nr:hypothetical protein [Chloroflexota bacterium]